MMARGFNAFLNGLLTPSHLVTFGLLTGTLAVFVCLSLHSPTGLYA